MLERSPVGHFNIPTWHIGNSDELFLLEPVSLSCYYYVSCCSLCLRILNISQFHKIWLKMVNNMSHKFWCNVFSAHVQVWQEIIFLQVSVC